MSAGPRSSSLRYGSSARQKADQQRFEDWVAANSRMGDHEQTKRELRLLLAEAAANTAAMPIHDDGSMA